MVTTAEYLAQIARESEANARAVAEGFESAAHKEMYANYQRKQDDPNALEAAEYERQANIRAAQVTDPRTGAPFASASDMEAYANTQSQKVFNPATGAYFTSAADYEIDANRRAREAGWLNAADLELYGPEGATRSDDPFVDPRDLPAPIIPPQFATGTANQYIWDPVTGNPIYVGDNSVSGAARIRPGGAAGSMDLLSYRPGTQKHWDQYLPHAAKGLMYMNLPPPEYSLAYAPGEWLAPKTWRDVIDAPGDQMRDIPQGAWRYATYKPSAYNEAGYPKQGISATTTDLNMPGWPTRMPWQFTSPAMRTNIAQQPWSAAQMNLSPEQAQTWQGLLTDLGAAPAIDTTPLSLLGVA
jgi:hypothetical protein